MDALSIGVKQSAAPEQLHDARWQGMPDRGVYPCPFNLLFRRVRLEACIKMESAVREQMDMIGLGARRRLHFGDRG